MNLPSISIRRPITILCVVILTLILGMFSLMKMPVDLFPDVTFPVLAIQVTYPGASPLDLEKQVLSDTFKRVRRENGRGEAEMHGNGCFACNYK